MGGGRGDAQAVCVCACVLCVLTNVCTPGTRHRKPA